MFDGMSASVSAAMGLLVSFRHKNIAVLNYYQGVIEGTAY